MADARGGQVMDPFGREDMTEDRLRTALDGLLASPETCIAEAVRHIHYASSARRRNVRIADSYQRADYWDGSGWWSLGIREAVDRMAASAVGELEHCADWSERATRESVLGFEAYMERYRGDEALRERVRADIVEVMIKPFPDADE